MSKPYSYQISTHNSSLLLVIMLTPCTIANLHLTQSEKVRRSWL